MAGLSPRPVGSSCSAGQLDPTVDQVSGDDNNNDDAEKDSPKNKNNFSFATKKYLMKYGLMNERSVSFVIPDDKDEETEPQERAVKLAPDEESRSVDGRTTSASPASSSRRSNMVLDLQKIQHLPKLT